FAVVSTAAVAAVLVLAGIGIFRGKTYAQTVSLLAVIGFHGTVVSYWAIWGIQRAFRYYRRSAELETELVKAQLGALKVQLQPHFLFNVLNAIMVLVQKGRGREGEDMLARLSDLLRCVLEDIDAQEVPLRRELEYVKLYLSIEQVRFADRLRVDIAADAAALDAAVPPMALQPIVENAVRHGIGGRGGGGRTEIGARRRDGTLEREVRDDGPGVPVTAAAGAPGHGIGLANTRARLARLYGDAAGLAVANSELGGAVVTMTMPFRAAEDAAHAAGHPHP